MKLQISNFQENETIELKASFSDEVVIALTAFANTKGGTVYVCIKDNGSIQGVDIGKETIQKWLNEIKIKTQPSIIPSVDILSKENKNIVCIRVNEFSVKPVSFKGRYYKRINNSVHQLSPVEITDLNLQSLQLSWDAYPAQNTSIENIDEGKAQNFVDKVNAMGRFNLHGGVTESLQKLKLINDGKITNAALLLFSKDEVVYNIHLGRFKTPSLIIDDKMLRLPLFEAVEETMKYLISHIKFAFEITGKTTQRTEIPEYPLDALRELVLNAIIHRDYLSPADIQIKIFDDHISFFNPGKLHPNLSINDLKTNYYPAYARNKLIAEAFYLTGDIEKYGSGFLRIRKSIALYPTMKVDYAEIGGGFMASIAYTRQKISANEPQETDNVTDNVTDNNHRETSIIALMRDDHKISTKKLAEKLAVTKMTIHRAIEKLKAEGRLERIGAAKGGFWKIIENE